MGFMFLRGANEGFASIIVDESHITYKTPLFTRRLRVADLCAVERRRRSRVADLLVFRPSHGFAVRFAPGMFVDENRLRRCLRVRVESAGLRWPGPAESA